jgi:membrane protein required for colicin V production
LSVSPFDIAVVLILLGSGAFGWVRGATREVTTVIAFIAAVVIAVFGLRSTGPLARHAIHTAWIANTAAVLLLFAAAYLVLRIIGGALTQRVKQTAALSSLDRILGFGIGLVRGFVVVGAVTLLLNAATPPERMPAWISKARLYPLADTAAAMLKAFAPEGLRVAHNVAPTVAGAVKGDADEATGEPGDKPSKETGYTAQQRKSLDDLVEKSR